jgi:hypothetical protein
MMLPKYIYRVSNYNKTTHMTCRFRDISYNVGFLFKEHPTKMIKHISEDSKVEIVDYTSNESLLLKIEKKININKLNCSVTYDEFAKFLAGPFIHNVGGLVVYELTYEDKDEYLFDSQIIEPKYDPKLFVKQFEKE